MIENYFIIIITVTVLGLLFKLPILPDKPMRFSWTISIVFPTIIIAISFYAIFDYFNIYNNIYTAIIIGIFATIFSRFILERLFPVPDLGDSS
jgi:energy-converting hydrogenase A subunit A